MRILTLNKSTHVHRGCAALSGSLGCRRWKRSTLQVSPLKSNAVNMSFAPQDLANLDCVINEPVRFMIMMLLYPVPEADFLYIQRECALTQGNLSSHLRKLDDSGYVFINKMFKGKYPLTICSLTKKGRRALEEYVRTLRMACAQVSASRA